jgi:hypothetical protein
MCQECRQFPCDPRCPNAPDPEEIPVYVCSGCGEEIMDGEDVWEFLCEQFCETCVDKARKTARAAE